MLRPIFTAATLSLAAFSVGAAPSSLEKKSCSNIVQSALSVANNLQSNYWSILGYYSGNRHWTDANTLEDIYNLMSLANVDTWSDLIYQSQLGIAGNAHVNSAWDLLLGGSYDDAGWLLLLYIRIRDYVGSANTNFDTSATQVYNYISPQWSSDCGGGVWWSKAHDFKNTITNALFLHTSAAMYLRHKDHPEYLTNAKNTWNWLASSGLRDMDNLWFDGMHSCTVDSKTKWTYNQGVIASGLGVLYAATGDKSYLDEAEKTLDAVVSKMTSNGILKEVCDDAVNSSCNEDQYIFKGIFMKHLQYYLDQTGGDAARVAKYAGFISAQSSGVYHYATGSSGQPGNVWYAGSQGGSHFTARTVASGLEAHIAQGKYGNCFNL